MERTAAVSPCGRYRFQLGRRWAPGTTATWIMLNPSTADAEVDDPTIRRCIGFSRAWGHGALEVVNLYAWRATKPGELLTAAEPLGAGNVQHVASAIADGDVAVAAWGAKVTDLLRAGIPRIAPESVLLRGTKPLMCLGTTKDGHPRHPLYVKADTPLVPFAPSPDRRRS